MREKVITETCDFGFTLSSDTFNVPGMFVSKPDCGNFRALNELSKGFSQDFRVEKIEFQLVGLRRLSGQVFWWLAHCFVSLEVDTVFLKN